MTITNYDLPHGHWLPRKHQNKLWEYLQSGGKRAVAIWHRRAGKDEVALHHTAVMAMVRPANYWHCFPEFTQARKAIWTAVNPHTGLRRIDEAFPHEIRSATREQEMSIGFVNGSTWTCVGSDSVTQGGGIGSSTAGIVFSEYALANPAAWAYYRPILEENNGWAAFITTPRGRNHAFSIFQHAQRTPGWFAERLTVHDTGALSSEAIAETLKEYTALYGEVYGRAQYEQEYLCSFHAANIGAIYSEETRDVREQGRVKEIAPLKDKPIHRSWDLGMRDNTAVWMFQAVGPQLYVFDCFTASGVSLEWYANQIETRYAERGWMHGVDYVPHDAKVRELGTGATRVETLKTLGLNPQLARDATLMDGINAVRRTLPLCVFHPRCEEGLAALEQYQREWDDEKKCFRASPLHDWTSDYADSARYMSLSWKPAPPRDLTPAPREGYIIPPPRDHVRRGIRL